MSTNHPEVSVHLLRLYHLRDHVWPLAEAREKAGTLDFDQFRSECGTYACLLGEAAMTPQLQADGWHWGFSSPVYHDIHAASANGRMTLFSASAGVEIYYGITLDRVAQLFGMRSYGGLADRRRVLDTIIAEKEAELAARQPEGASHD